MICLYCNNEVEPASPRAKEGICKSCSTLDMIGNQLQVQVAKDCLEKARMEKCERNISMRKMGLYLC
jgi:hypothetical protein